MEKGLNEVEKVEQGLLGYIVDSCEFVSLHLTHQLIDSYPAQEHLQVLLNKYAFHTHDWLSVNCIFPAAHISIWHPERLRDNWADVIWTS